MMIMTRWCFQTLFVFTSTWEHDPILTNISGLKPPTDVDDDVDDNVGRSFWLENRR